jgi:hypothetical protein
MASVPSISIGQHFRDVQQRTFGRPGLEWIVEACHTGTDGVAYARLICATDTSNRKTLSIAVLAERARFLRIES